MGDMTKRLGFIVNPLAGIGGRVGLKGSDGDEIVRRALDLGASREAPHRAELALRRLAAQPVHERIEIVTWPGEMGESEARAAGFEPTVVGSLAGRPRLATRDGEVPATTGADTEAGGARPARGRRRPAALRRRRRHGAQPVQRRRPCRPRRRYPGRRQDPLRGATPTRRGRPATWSPRSWATGPRPPRCANPKSWTSTRRRSATTASRPASTATCSSPTRAPSSRAPRPAASPETRPELESIATEVVNGMQPDVLYLLGPGTTTRAIAERLGLAKTLLGVDAVIDRAAAGSDSTSTTSWRCSTHAGPAPVSSSP